MIRKLGIILAIIVLITTLISCVASYPVSGREKRDVADSHHDESVNHGDAWSSPFMVTLAVVSVVCLVSIVAMCSCCQDALFSPKSDAGDTYSAAARSRRHSMEPPSDGSLSTPRADGASATGGAGAVTIEPLPDIASAKSAGKTYTKPIGYNQVVNKGPDVSDWFKTDNNAPDFPRGQLQYVKELGSGWFGSVIEGEASKMSPQRKKVKVVVQILREELTSMERAYLLYTARMFRDVHHENILRIIGKCVDKEPYLLLYEHCPQGDYLKSYLIARRGVSDDLVHSGAVMKMCCEVADGLVALHQKGFVHNDLACRNCLVSSNGMVKIGDYGTGFSVFKDEYVTVGDIGVPIRWISPDTVDVTPTGQLLTKEVTQIDNVWTLGVIVWEILEFGKLPYMELNNEGVVNSVLKNRSAYLQPPVCPMPHRDRLYEVMRFCWLPSSSRPSSEQIAALLKHVFHFRPTIDSVDDFDSKWNSLVAAQQQKPGLQAPVAAAVNGVHSYSPIPNDPSTMLDSTAAVGEKIVAKQEEAPPQTAAAPATVPVVESAAMVPPPRPPPPQLSKIVPPPPPGTTNDEMDAERIEKRTFILTLSMVDLAAMSKADLAQFYEYLSSDEIRDLEQRHATATEETREAEEKRKNRDEFLAMTLDEMEELSAEQLEYYMRCLDDVDRKETREKLAVSASEKEQKKKQEEEEFNRNRRRYLSLINNGDQQQQQLLALTDEQINEAKSYLSPDEFVDFEDRRRKALNEDRRRKLAEQLLNLDDRELVRMDKEELESRCRECLADDNEQDSLMKKYEKLSHLKMMIVQAGDDELRNMTDAELEHVLANVLTPAEAEEIRQKRKRAIEMLQAEVEEAARRKRTEEEEQQAKAEAEKKRMKREKVFSLTNVQLARDVSEEDLKSFADVLDVDEMNELQMKISEAIRARKYLLSMDEEVSRAMGNDELEKYLQYLTADEIAHLESIRQTTNPNPTPPLTPIIAESASSPSVQGSVLADEALYTAKQDLINGEADNGDSPSSEQQNGGDSITVKSITKQHSAPSKRDVAVPPLNLSSASFDHATVIVDAPMIPITTPEVRKEEHDQRRLEILAATGDALAAMSDAEFESYFQYLSPEEIFDLAERRKNNSVTTTAEKGEENSNIDGRDNSVVENGRETSPEAQGDQEDQFNSRSAWEARDYVLHLSDSDLAELQSVDLRQYSTYFSSDEFTQIEHRWADLCEKRDFLVHSTDEDLAVLPTERLEDYLIALPEAVRAEIRERVNVIQTRWLPATLRDEYAFREILKTVPSISASESESWHHTNHHGPKSFTSSRDHDQDQYDHRSRDQYDDRIDHRADTPLSSPDERRNEPNSNFLNSSDAPPSLSIMKGPAGGGLQIPIVQFQAATPIEEQSPTTEFRFAVGGGISLEESGLVDDQQSGGNGGDDDQHDDYERATSTPLYESFAESMLKDMGDFSQQQEQNLQQDLSGAYVTASADPWSIASAGDIGTPPALVDTQPELDQANQGSKSHELEGDLLGDFDGRLDGSARNGQPPILKDAATCGISKQSDFNLLD